MKARSTPVVLSLALALLAPSSFWAADAAASHAFVDPDDPALAEIRQLGERTIDHAGATLLNETRQVLASHAPALAIGMLHLKDYKLPAPVPGRPAVITLKRTSLRVRNPANTADAPDLAALELIEDRLENGDPVPKVLIQRVTLPGFSPEWRVYRPLGVMKSCLDCHGRAEDLAPGVADTLKIYFPSDQAVDYKTGAWRGLIRVSIIEPAKNHDTPVAAAVASRQESVLQPCAEACAFFRQIHPDRWSDFGRCANPRSPHHSYPVRIGRDCRYFQSKPTPS